MRTTILFFFTFKSVVDMFCEGTYGDRLRVVPDWGYFPPPVFQSNPYRSAMDHMVDVTNNLGVAILKDHAYTRGNFAFSPYGVASVLVVLYEGARGRSAHQIHWAAGFPPDRDIVRIGFRDLHRRLKSYFSHEGYLSGITLSKEASALKPEYKKILEFYGYDVNESDIQDEEEGNGVGEKEENPVNNSTSTTDHSTSSTQNSITENAFRPTESTEPLSSTTTTDKPEIANTTEENEKDITTTTAGKTTQLDVELLTNEKDDMDVASTVTTEGFTTSLLTNATTQKTLDDTTTTEKSDSNPTTAEDITSSYNNIENKETSSVIPDPETTTIFFTTVQPSITEQQHKEEDVEKPTSKAPQSNISTGLETADEKTTETPPVNLIPETTTSFSLNLTTITPSSVEQQQNEKELEDFEKTKTTTVVSGLIEETEKNTEIPSDVLTTVSSSLTTTPFVKEPQKEEKPEVEKTTLLAITTLSDKGIEESAGEKSSSTNPETTLGMSTMPSSVAKEPQEGEKPEEVEKTTLLESTTLSGTGIEESTGEKSSSINPNPETTVGMSTMPSSVAKEPQEGEKPEEVEKTTFLESTTLSATGIEDTAGEKSSSMNPNHETALGMTTMSSSVVKEPQEGDKPVDIKKTTTVSTQGFNETTEETTEESTITSQVDMSSETTISSSMPTKPFPVTEEPQKEDKPEKTTVTSLNTTEKYVEDSESLSTGTAPSFFEPTTKSENSENNNMTVSIDLEQSSSTTIGNNQKKENQTLHLSLDYGEDDEEDEENEDGEEQHVPSLEFDIEETEKKRMKQNKRNPRFSRSFSEEGKIRETDDKNESGKPQAFKYLFPIRKRSLKMEDNSKKKGILICKECLLGNEEKREKHEVISGGRKKRISELELNLQLQNGMYDSRNYDPYRVSHRPFLVDGLTHAFVPFMTYTNIFPYAYIPALNSKALEFPLDDIRYKLLILYPMERRGLKKLIYDLSYVPLREVVETLRPFRVKVTVPTFMVEGFVTLTSSLKNMGIWDVFDPRKSDLSGMSLDPELYVTNVEQSIKVVIRNYVEYLDMPTRVFGGRTREYEFQIWHPFLYFVLDSATNVALMAGQVVDPLNSRVY